MCVLAKLPLLLTGEVKEQLEMGCWHDIFKCLSEQRDAAYITSADSLTCACSQLDSKGNHALFCSVIHTVSIKFSVFNVDRVTEEPRGYGTTSPATSY